MGSEHTDILKIVFERRERSLENNDKLNSILCSPFIHPEQKINLVFYNPEAPNAIFFIFNHTAIVYWSLSRYVSLLRMLLTDCK